MGDVTSLLHSLFLSSSLPAALTCRVLIYKSYDTGSTEHSAALHPSHEHQGQKPDGPWCPGPGSLVSTEPG